MENSTTKTNRYESSYEVEVRSNFEGQLIYVSKSTGFQVIWEKIGDVNYMTIGDLKEMVATQRAFFKQNWITINEEDAEDICRFLRVSDCYNANIIVSDFVKRIDKMGHKEINKRLKNTTGSVRASIARAVKKEFNEGRIDSVSKIKMLEKTLGVSIISADDEDE